RVCPQLSRRSGSPEPERRWSGSRSRARSSRATGCSETTWAASASVHPAGSAIWSPVSRTASCGKPFGSSFSSFPPSSCSSRTASLCSRTVALQSSERSAEADEKSLHGCAPRSGPVKVDVVPAGERDELGNRKLPNHCGGFVHREVTVRAPDDERRRLDRPPFVPVGASRGSERRNHDLDVESRAEAVVRGLEVPRPGARGQSVAAEEVLCSLERVERHRPGGEQVANPFDRVGLRSGGRSLRDDK